MFSSLSLTDLLVALAWVGAAGWAVALGMTLYALARQKPLPPPVGPGPAAEDAPLVSVLLPARNEAGRVLAESVRSLLNQDYEALEVIAVNDRSTDRTGEILHALALEDERLRVIDGREPPAGWLGKPHALRQAFESARGEWVLTADADVVFERGAVRTALEFARGRELDALTLVPYVEAPSFWERVVIPAWVWVLRIALELYRVNDPRSRRAMGIGGFFLLRRAALERAGGFEALRDEAAEDFALAERLKAAGASLRMEYAPRLARTRMYSNFAELWECHAKNFFAGTHYSLPLALAAAAWMLAGAVVPVAVALACAAALALGAGEFYWRLFVPTFLVWVLQVLALAPVCRRLEVPVRYALTAPLGVGLLYLILFESSLRIATGRGVTWKGRRVYERAGGVRPPRGGPGRDQLSP